MGLHSWQWLFIIEAATGALFGLMAPFFIPDFPGADTGASKIWLTEDMRKIAAARMVSDRVSEPAAEKSIWNGVKLVLKDFKTWVFVSIVLLSSRLLILQDLYL